MKSLSKFLKIIISALFIFFIFIIGSSTVWALEPTVSPTPIKSGPTLAVSPTTKATPTVTKALSETPTPNKYITPTKTASSSAGKKKEVLGAATKLGSTSAGTEIAKWMLAGVVGVAAILAGLKIVRTNVEE